MTDAPRRKGLGRGLAALIDDAGLAAQAEAEGGAREIAIDLIRANPDQPRKTFDEDEIEALAQSIRERGVIQPLVLRPAPSGEGYEIVAGERRWRAAQRARLHAVPAIIRRFDDSEALEVALLENVQRADLNPVEEATGYAQLIERYGHTQDRLAQIIGKSRSHIANTLRLLTLPEPALTLLRAGKLSAGHARAALGAENPAALAETAAREGLSVRETERRAKARTAPTAAAVAPRAEKDADTRALEADLAAATGLAVTIQHREAGGGELRIRYRDLDQLDGLCQLLMR